MLWSKSRSATASTSTRPVAADPGERRDDPVRDWLLQPEDLDTTEFSVLFAINKLRARPRMAGWIRYCWEGC